jgi:predicted enzyme related to lactoylglutathione lyase
MEAVDVRGRFVWHELMTRDVPGARKFYSRLAGWRIEPWNADPNYSICLNAVGPQAGVFAIPDDMPADMPAHWVSYIGTRDVDGTADAAVRAGASMLKEPTDIAGAGRYAVLKDPQGAVFAILDPENARPEVAGAAAPGAFAWHELATLDSEAALAFYGGLFGWDAIEHMDMGPAGIYLIFGSHGIRRGGMYVKQPDNPMPPNWLPYVAHADSDQAHAFLVTAGGTSMLPPMSVPGGGRIAIFLDPTGAAFATHSMPAAEANPAPKAKAKPKTEPKAKPKAKLRTKPKAKTRAAPAKKKSAARKPAAKRKVLKKPAAKKAVRKPPKKRSPARHKSKSVRRKK